MAGMAVNENNILRYVKNCCGTVVLLNMSRQTPEGGGL